MINHGLKRYFVFLILIFIVPFKNGICQETSLPLITKNCGENSKPLIFHISGDGGWRGFDIKMADEYNANGLSYVMLNSFKYFWSTKTPDQLVKDVVPVLRNYLKMWNKNEMIFVGFSFGAEILPFFFTRLPDDLKKKVILIVLITPGKTSDFTIHIKDMMSLDGNYAYDVVKEVAKIKTSKILSIFGEKESLIFPESGQQKNLKIEYVKGGHHFTDGKSVMELILPEF
jgi:type IV secretory pathway VirJ component